MAIFNFACRAHTASFLLQSLSFPSCLSWIELVSPLPMQLCKLCSVISSPSLHFGKIVKRGRAISDLKVPDPETRVHFCSSRDWCQLTGSRTALQFSSARVLQCLLHCCSAALCRLQCCAAQMSGRSLQHIAFHPIPLFRAWLSFSLLILWTFGICVCLCMIIIDGHWEHCKPKSKLTQE